jgi:hypothetical protein
MALNVRPIALGVLGFIVSIAGPLWGAECPSAQVKPQFQKPINGQTTNVGVDAPVQFKGVAAAPGGCTLPNLEVNLQIIRQSPPGQATIGVDAPVQGGQFTAQKVLSAGTYLVKAQFNRKTEGWPSYGTLTQISFTVSNAVLKGVPSKPLVPATPPVPK